MDWVVEGTVLADKYRLERKLGQGGMGAVWRAEHVQLRSPVAIKLIDHQIVAHPDALARFLREAQSAAALRSPHVVQILDFGADRGVPYIAMELLEGESLADRIARVGRLSPPDVARLMTQVARALGKAHEMGIVHRDIKPDNIFIVRNDEDEVAKVLDFGIAKSAQHGLGPGSGSTTRTGAILGTPNYMSPEQAEGTKLVDHRTDLWALGVIGFECLVGRKPFDSDALGSLLLAICTRPIPVPSQWGFNLPGFDQWFARACARELSERHQTARELAAELRQVCGVVDSREPSPSRQSGSLPALHARPITGGTLTTPYGAAGPATGNPFAPGVTASAQRKTPVLAIALVLTVIAVVVAGSVALFVRKSRVDAAVDPAASSPVAATQSPAPVEQKPSEVAVAAPAPTLMPVAPVAVEPAGSASAAPEASARPPAAVAAMRPRPVTRKPSTPAAAVRPATPAARPTPPPPTPLPPPPEPKPEPKPASNKVNLGI
jgi:serine/threonine-protein kinase